MSPARRRIARDLIVLCVLGPYISIVPLTTSHASVAPSGPPTGLIAIGRGDVRAATPRPYRYVVLNAWNYRQIPKIRVADPGVEIYVYKDMSSTRSYACHSGKDDRLLPTGIGYCWTERHHPGWFLGDETGSRIEWRGYPGHWWMDVGIGAYQRRWRSNVLSELRRKGWDGVMVDNAILDPRYYLGEGESIPKYPSVRAYRSATRAFLRTVGPSIRSGGFGFVPNIGGADATAMLLHRWSVYTTGFLREHWSRYGTGSGAPFGGWDWDRQMAQMDAVEAVGKTWFCVTYGATTDGRLMQYAQASFLLAWNGTSGALFYHPEQGDPWAPDWTTDVGMPTAPRYAVGEAWRRDFSGGTVVVNPSQAQVTIQLGGTYATTDGTRVDEITLAPATGAVLEAV
jgi:hypothetical protein